jgi:glucose-1-phosphatase
METIIFDLGGILIDIHYSKTEESFNKLGFTNFSKVYKQSAQHEFVDQYEKGEIDSDLFIKHMLNHSEVEISKKDFKKAWCAMLGELQISKLELLYSLKDSYDFYLYSNINDIHLNVFKEIIKSEFSAFESIFKKIYYSCEYGFNKPYQEGFKKIIKDNKLNPKDTMFIDDTSRHVESAIKCGINGILIKSNTEYEEWEETIFPDKFPSVHD